MKVRPTGITLIGILYLVLGGLSFLWSLLVFGVGGVSSIFTTLFTFSPTVSSSFTSGALGMLAGAVQLAAAIGLLRLRSWGWYLAVLGVGLSVLQGLLGLFSGGIFTFVCTFAGILIPAAILIYLLQPDIRDLFNIGK
ncbi:MAG: hypothetical protein ACK2U5_11960 [Candidatus Promineifilaceae bacterium]